MGNQHFKNKKELKKKEENKKEEKNSSENETKKIVQKKINFNINTEEKLNVIDAEKEEEKIIIEDFSKELKIHPKKIKNLDKEMLKQLQKYFHEYRCSICLFKIIINIERKEDNILYVTTKCHKNHTETKPLSQFLIENKFEINENFKLYDFVPNDVRLMEMPIKQKRFIRWEWTSYYYNEYRNREDELYLICSKCNKIYDVKESYLDKINHEHVLFQYYIIGYGERDNYGYGKHLLKFKAQDYLEKKIIEEKKYYDSINELLIKNKLEKEYTSYLKEIEKEINFFEYYYKKYSDTKTIRRFTNLNNIYKHSLIPFELEEKDKNINKELEDNIQQLNIELNSLYALNTFDKIKKITIDDYEFHTLKPPENIYYSISLDEPYFASGGSKLFIYKIENKIPEKNDHYKHKITLVLEVNEIEIFAMIYLGNRKIISVGYKGINLIQFEENYKGYNILFHIMDNFNIKNIIRGNDESFISYGENLPIWKWKINKEENNIEKLFCLNSKQSIKDICKISNKYFAYQTEDHIHILNVKTFAEKIKIEYEWHKYSFLFGLVRYSDEILGAISNNRMQIGFFNVETGEKVFEIKDDNESCFLLGFLKTNREKNENEIIAISEYFSGRGGYGLAGDFSLHNNKWEKLIHTFTSSWTYSLRHIYEMKDKTILISAQNQLHVLFYPQD